MDKQNICNFNFNRSSDLVCDRFVYEKKNAQNEFSISHTYEMGLVTLGAGSLRVGERRWELSEGTIFLIRRGDSFSVEGSDDHFEYCYICFRGRRADELIDRLGITAERCVFEGFSAIADFWLECICLAERENVDLLSESVLLYTFACLRPVATEQSDLISRMVAITAENFHASDFNLIRLASIIGYDEKYLSSAFKKQRGVAYSTYLRELRIGRAIFLMEQGLVSVKNIALLSGFSDPLYFSKVFKESEGISPKDFIKQINERKVTKG